MEVGVAQSVCHLTSVCHTNGILRHECHRIFIIYCILVTTMSHQWKSAANGEGQGCSVCLLFDVRLSHQWNFAAQMSQNFHHILYISDYNVSPMEICGTNVTEFLPLFYTPYGDGEGQGYTICPLVHVCQSHQQKSAAQMSQNFHHILYISDYNVSPIYTPFGKNHHEQPRCRVFTAIKVPSNGCYRPTPMWNSDIAFV